MRRSRGQMAPRVVRALALVAVVPAVVAAVQKVCDALGMLVRRGDKLRVWRPRANLQVSGAPGQKKRAF